MNALGTNLLALPNHFSHYAIETRESLRQINDPGWEATFGQVW